MSLQNRVVATCAYQVPGVVHDHLNEPKCAHRGLWKLGSLKMFGAIGIYRHLFDVAFVLPLSLPRVLPLSLPRVVLALGTPNFRLRSRAVC